MFFIIRISRNSIVKIVLHCENHLNYTFLIEKPNVNLKKKDKKDANQQVEIVTVNIIMSAAELSKIIKYQHIPLTFVLEYTPIYKFKSNAIQTVCFLLLLLFQPFTVNANENSGIPPGNGNMH